MCIHQAIAWRNTQLLTELFLPYMQLSKNYLIIVSTEYDRITAVMVGLTGLEPVTPALSRRCSNQLSYRPLDH